MVSARGRAGRHCRALPQCQKQRFAHEQKHPPDDAHAAGKQEPDVPNRPAGLALAGAVALGGEDRGSGKHPDASHHDKHERRQ